MMIEPGPLKQRPLLAWGFAHSRRSMTKYRHFMRDRLDCAPPQRRPSSRDAGMPVSSSTPRNVLREHAAFSSLRHALAFRRRLARCRSFERRLVMNGQPFTFTAL
jgi:hypothetical protein